MAMSNQTPRTIFITGASSGLGKATAKLFALKDWKVIATMRNPEKEKELNITLSWSKFLQLFVNEVGDLRKELARLKGKK